MYKYKGLDLVVYPETSSTYFNSVMYFFENLKIPIIKSSSRLLCGLYGNQTGIRNALLSFNKSLDLSNLKFMFETLSSNSIEIYVGYCRLDYLNNLSSHCEPKMVITLRQNKTNVIIHKLNKINDFQYSVDNVHYICEFIPGDFKMCSGKDSNFIIC